MKIKRSALKIKQIIRYYTEINKDLLYKDSNQFAIQSKIKDYFS